MHLKLLDIGLHCRFSVQRTQTADEKVTTCSTLPHARPECELTLMASPTVKPDPPSNVTAWQVEGHSTKMKVTWNLPTSWRHHGQYYKLSFELKYRPLMSSFQYEQVSNQAHKGNNPPFLDLLC